MNVFIVRHGNTFLPNSKVTRVGAKTDISLVDSGISQAHELGLYFRNKKIFFDKIYCSSLLRTAETAHIIRNYQIKKLNIEIKLLFDEIDHGEDEGKTDLEIVNRIGSKALMDWENYGIVPRGWIVNEEIRILGWKNFLRNHLEFNNVLIVTSNGAARFVFKVIHVAGKIESLKLRTGAFGVITQKSEMDKIELVNWNLLPKDLG
jgi:broad specificity phosphatase PhoE